MNLTVVMLTQDPEAGQNVSFQAAVSPGEISILRMPMPMPPSILHYRWTLSDTAEGIVTEGPILSHSFAEPGTYQLTVKAITAAGFPIPPDFDFPVPTDRVIGPALLEVNVGQPTPKTIGAVLAAGALVVPFAVALLRRGR